MVEVLRSLQSGKAFTVEFFCWPERMPPQIKGQLSQELRDTLGNLKAKFRGETEFRFEDGLDFELLADVSEPIVYPMRDESTEYPSMFRLPAGSRHQVYVVVSAIDANGVMQLVHLLMWRVADEWKARNIWARSERADALDFVEVLAAAGEEERRDCLLLAFALQTRAAQVAAGPAYRTTGKQRRLLPVQEAFAARHGRRGSGDVLETADGRTEIEKSGSVELADGPYLLLCRRVPAIRDDKKMEAAQRRLARACLKRYPRVKQYFVGIAVESMSANPSEQGRGYRSAHAIDALEDSKSD